MARICCLCFIGSTVSTAWSTIGCLSHTIQKHPPAAITTHERQPQRQPLNRVHWISRDADPAPYFHIYRQHNKFANVFHYISISFPLIYHQPVPNLQLEHQSCSISLCGADYCDDPFSMMSSPTIQTVHKLTISLPLTYH